MRSILLDLYYGNYSLPGQRISNESAYGKALHTACSLEDELTEDFSEGQKACFGRYLDAETKLTDVACRMNFEAGFRLGARLMMEALSDAPNE